MSTTTGVAPSSLTLADLPQELLLPIVQQVSPSTQRQLSAVSTAFRCAMTDCQLDVGLKRAVLRIDRNPEVTPLFCSPDTFFYQTAESSQTRIFVERDKNLAPFNCLPTLVVVDQRSQKTYRLELPGPIDSQCVALHDSRFLVATKEGILSCWEASSTGVTCHREINLFENIDLNGMEAPRNPTVYRISLKGDVLRIRGLTDGADRREYFDATVDANAVIMVLQPPFQSNQRYEQPYTRSTYNRHFPRSDMSTHLYHTTRGLTFKPQGTELQIWDNSSSQYLRSVNLPYPLSDKKWDYGIESIRLEEGRLNLVVQDVRTRKIIEKSSAETKITSEQMVFVDRISFALDVLDDEAASAVIDEVKQERATRFPYRTFQDTVQSHLSSSSPGIKDRVLQLIGRS